MLKQTWADEGYVRVKLWEHNGDLPWKWLPGLPSWEQPALSCHAAQNFSFPSCSVFMQCKPGPKVLYGKSRNYFLSWSVGICIKARGCWKACLFKRENKRWKSRGTFLHEKLWDHRGPVGSVVDSLQTEQHRKSSRHKYKSTKANNWKQLNINIFKTYRLRRSHKTNPICMRLRQRLNQEWKNQWTLKNHQTKVVEPWGTSLQACQSSLTEYLGGMEL